MRRATFVNGLFALAVLPWCGCKHVCDDTPSDAVDFFEPIEGAHPVEIGWAGLVESGVLDESQALTTGTVEVVLDRATAGADDANSSIGCDQRYTIDATLLITSADGLLDESIPIAFAGDPATGGTIGFADLSNYSFSGALDLGPQPPGGRRMLHISFTGDSLQTAFLIADDGLNPDGEDSVGGLVAIFNRPN